MKKINMKKGFTMIELVFVIVIIGILSAVALPKFLETSTQAHNAIVVSFAGTLNRTVGPTLWAKSIAGGGDGTIDNYCDNNFEQYTKIPDELENKSCLFTAKTGSGATYDIKMLTSGSLTTPPVWLVIK